MQCPRCNHPMEPAVSISEAPSTDWLVCTNPICNTYYDTYKPMPHQTSVHTDIHRIIGNFGSYGTGKTKTSEKEIEKHILITPNANILLGANVSSQYEQTLLRDFEKSFPKAFVQSRNVQKQYIDFINGARLMLRPFDDPDKLRSNNYSLVVMLEASEITPEAYHQLKTRLRNKAATYNNHDWRKLICESNPDAGWIRTDVLMVSDKIYRHGKTSEEEYDQSAYTIDHSISTHIASTDVNTYLPADYIEVNSRNKPLWWVQRFIYGSFSFAEGLVYPSFSRSVIATPNNFKLPSEYKVIIAHDYGLQDPSTFIFGYIDTDRGKLVIYKDIRTNETSVQGLAQLFKDNCKDIALGQLYTTPIIDPKNNKRDYNKKDLISHYAEYGVQFKPGHIQREARIFRLNDYFETGRIEIFDSCKYLIKELTDYKFKPRSLNSDKNSKDEPIEVNDHSICALEWIVMELPADPTKLELEAFNSEGELIVQEDYKRNHGGWQLEDSLPEPPAEGFIQGGL